MNRLSESDSVEISFSVKQLSDKHSSTCRAAGVFCKYAQCGTHFTTRAQHLVEMVCEIFGPFPKNVIANRVDEQTYVVFHYDTFDCMGIYVENNHKYYAAVMTDKASYGEEIYPDEARSLLPCQLAEFKQLLYGGKLTTPYEKLIAPVFIMNAINRSLEEKTEQIINYAIKNNTD